MCLFKNNKISKQRDKRELNSHQIYKMFQKRIVQKKNLPLNYSSNPADSGECQINTFLVLLFSVSAV